MKRVVSTGCSSFVAPSALVALTLVWFAPVMFAGRVFSSDNYLPGFFLPLTWWSDMLYSGYPLFADLAFGNAYPIRIALASLAGIVGPAWAYNLFVWSAFAIGGIGTYRYVVEITEEPPAALVASLAFATCGFMQAHMGHETIVHTAAWLPLVVLAIHRLVARNRGSDMAILALVIAMAYLASHPEILLQIGFLAGLYAVVNGAPSRSALRSMLLLAAAVVLALALVAWHLVPALDYASFSQRAQTARVLSLEGALPVDQLAQVALPWVFGNPFPSFLAPHRHFGYQMFPEVVAYVAPGVFVLAALGAISRWSLPAARFWVFAAALFFVLALGPQTLLGKLQFFAPGFRLFRIPARDVLSAHFALSVLAGVGASAILRGTAGARRCVAATLIGLVPTVAAVLTYPWVVRKAEGVGLTVPPAWGNVAVVVPVALAILSASSIWLATRVRSPFAVAILAAVVLIGGLYFAWPAPWRIASYPKELLELPVEARALWRMNHGQVGRIAVADGWLGPWAFAPNWSMLFGIPNVAGYGPLLGRQYAEFTLLTNGGWMRPEIFRPSSRALDLLATRWVFPYSAGPPHRTAVPGGRIPWSTSSLGLAIGGSCLGEALERTATFRLPKAVRIDRVAMVSALMCGSEVPQGTVVAHVALEGPDLRGVLRLPVVAGIDTAEYMASCPPAGSRLLHQPGSVFDSSDVAHGQTPCQGHDYVAMLNADGRNADTIRIEWSMPSAYPRVEMRIQHITVVGDNGMTTQVVGTREFLRGDPGRWRRLSIRGAGEVFENLRARPRAWLAGSVVRVESHDEAIRVVHRGVTGDGRPFDPESTALVVDPVAVPTSGVAADRPPPLDPVAIEAWTSGVVRLAAQSQAPSMLVVSQQYYPGWSATVDGTKRPLLRVNGLLQGVELTAGKHEVTLTFVPQGVSILLGVAVGAMAVVVVLVCRGATRPGAA
jgi:membrane protein YfhO